MTVVSTHSRPKAAGIATFCKIQAQLCFNTQPPEGGWAFLPSLAFKLSEFQHTAARRRLALPIYSAIVSSSFNTQPPEGGWDLFSTSRDSRLVSTHSRPKAAGPPWVERKHFFRRFNTQPPEGGWDGGMQGGGKNGGFNTQPPEGGWR